MTADDSAETAVFLLIYPYLYVYNRHKDADYFLLLSAKSFNKKKERADSIIVESAQIVTFVFATKLQ